MTVRVAVIGAGHWHTPRYLDVLHDAGARVLAISDPDPNAVERFSRSMDCQGYAAHTDLLTEQRPDLVFALPRHHEAAAVASDLLDTGVPFAIEKPIGLHAGELAPIADRARASGAFAAVPFVNRYRPIWRWLGSYGTARHAHFRMVNGPASRYPAAGCDWMLRPELSGGGALRNLGVHAADAAVTVAGGDPDALEVVGASLGFDGVAEVEDYAIAVFAVAGGPAVTIEAGYTYPAAAAGMTRGGDTEWRIATAAGYLRDRDEGLTIEDANGVRQSADPFHGGYRRFVEDVLAGFRAGTPPIADIDDCLRAMRVVDRAYERAGAPWPHAAHWTGGAGPAE